MSKSSKRNFKIVSPDSKENNSLIESPFKPLQYDLDPKKSSYYKVAENL